MCWSVTYLHVGVSKKKIKKNQQNVFVFMELLGKEREYVVLWLL